MLQINEIMWQDNMQFASLHIPGPDCMGYGCPIANENNFFVWPDKGEKIII